MYLQIYPACVLCFNHTISAQTKKIGLSVIGLDDRLWSIMLTLIKFLNTRKFRRQLEKEITC